LIIRQRQRPQLSFYAVAARTWLATLPLLADCGPTRVGAAEALRPALRTSFAPAMALEEGWSRPPREARTRCWWWWLNGNVTKDAITRDLEAMRAQGLGGANVIDAGGAEQRGNRQVPHGPDFASPAWRELFLHALCEADRLDLELGFNIQSGWNLGGPTVEPRDAAKKLTFVELDVDGGRLIDQRLRPPRAVADYYQDAALVAVPLPAEAERELARVERFRMRAYYEYPGSFIAGDASHLLEVAPVSARQAPIAGDAVLDIASSLDADGRLHWQAPPGRWRLLRIGYTLAGSRVSTNSEGWDGWAIDYLDRPAFETYWRDVIAPMLDEAGPLVGRSLRYVHTDSWELGPVNWTPRMPERFRELRGYELARYLPALAGYVVDDAETTTRFLNDFRRTLADLIAESKYATFAEHAHARGLGIHPESGGPHAAPVDALLCLGRSDMPMGEFWARSRTHRVRDFERFFIKQPASAAHIYGRRQVLAESFTSIGPHWEEDPQSLKPEFDRAACEGLNLVVLHTLDCSPESMGVPGQAYFAGTHINPRVTWWKHADAFFGYLNRCQFLLQQGLPAADVLYFYGENVPSFVRLKRDDPAHVLPGYDYDVINLEAILERTRVEGGQIVLPDGVRFELLVLPRGDSYGLAALERIAALVEAGARVVGPQPSRPIGLSRSVEEERRFRELADRLWSPRGGGSGAITDVPAREALAAAGVAPDFEVRGVAEASDGAAENEAAVDFIHRRTSEGDVYFLANRRDERTAFDASFRMSGRQPELWNPVTSERRDAAAFAQADGRTVVPLELPAGGSVFVVFRRAIAPNARGIAQTNEPQLAPLVRVAGPWSVTFDERWGGPAEMVEFQQLDDWSTRPEEAIKYFSGSAVYRTTFELPADFNASAAGGRTLIGLGRVENVAAVRVNGKPLGVAWTEPFRVEATGVLQPRRNALEVEVTNLWPNRLIGDARMPREQRLTTTNITKFTADSPLLPSGLLGPVEILTAAPGSIALPAGGAVD
jgi:hypothetical protein